MHFTMLLVLRKIFQSKCRCPSIIKFFELALTGEYSIFQFRESGSNIEQPQSES